MPLSTPELHEKWGDLIDQGFRKTGRFTTPGTGGIIKSSITLDELVTWGKEYRETGGGTPEDRTEAVKAWNRLIYEQTKARNPDTELHAYKRHHLDRVEPGEADILEP